MKKVTSINEYFEVQIKYKKELLILRDLLLQFDSIKEELKWNAPIYTAEGKNIIGLGAFKNHFCLWFHNGVFFNDEKGLLYQASESTKALRQMRFEKLEDINENEVRYFINEALKYKNESLKSEKKEITIPEELKNVLALDKALENSFKQFTPYKQHEFIEYLDAAKREETKQTRLQKIIPMIKEGIGLHDKYR